jgi:hypothetical protein
MFGTNTGDCNDVPTLGGSQAHPGLVEAGDTCGDGLDNDCNGLIDCFDYQCVLAKTCDTCYDADPSADPCKVANWLPIETTMVASGTPMAAVTADLKTNMPSVAQVAASECSGFTENAGTIWDVASLRKAGVLPAPM